jgi:hypothetical protein
MFFYAFFLLTVTAASAGATVKIYNAELGRLETTSNTGLPPGIYLPGIHGVNQVMTKKIIVK